MRPIHFHLEDLAVGQTPVSGEYMDKEGVSFRGDRSHSKTDKFTAARIRTPLKWVSSFVLI